MAVAMLDCQHCGASGPSDAAHSNWSHHGKSFGRKADDIYVAALCREHHYEIDQGSNLTKAERQELWNAAFIKTVRELVRLGQWPAEIEIPEEAK